MACRFATWPTRRSPLLVNATTDGVIRPPSAFGMIVGSPPSMYATAELVVPRSIPMTFGMLLLLLLGDRDERWPDDPVVQSVRLLMFFDDGALGLVGLEMRDGLVQVGIEWFAERVNGFE